MDITERKEAQAALHESERFNHATLDALSAHVAVLDENGNIMATNKAWREFALANANDWKAVCEGANYLTVCDESAKGDLDASQAAKGIREVIANEKQSWFHEYPCHSPTEKRWFYCRVTRFPGDSPVRVVVAHENITERKEAQASHDRLAMAVEQAAETIVITDTEGTILYVNPAFEKITGYTRAEAMGQNPRVLKSGKHDKEYYRRMWAILKRGETWNGHFINQRKDGTLYDEEATISPVRDATGTVINYVAVKRDVTREMKLEAGINQAQKMESIGQLAGGIAHDFNNILSSITGYLFLAKTATANNPEAADYLEHIAKATNRATDLVKQILTFSRQNKPEREPIQLNEVVLEALKLLRASMPAAIRIQTELTETPAVLANASAIHQVIMNLGINAEHAMRGQPGTLKVEMNVWEADNDFVKTHPDLHPGRYVQLSISDTGGGMDAATQRRIFEPFFTTKGVGEGTGLGLSVVHGIMKSHDGGISIYSEPGQGTVFHLYFPVFETGMIARDIEAKPIPRGQGERILFVDDEATLASLGKQVLDRLDYRVTMTTSVTDAIAMVRAQPEPFDLVITDLAMPIIDGIKLGTELLQLQPRLPIILTTGFSGFMTPEKVRALGFRELLNKPSTVQTLGETVQRVLHPKKLVG